VHNARKNFTAIEFKQLVSSMSIKVKKVPVKAYNSVGLIKRYHALLRRVYEILKEELKDEHIDKEMILQIAVKAVNDLARPDEIVPTLLVFGLYLRMTEIDALSPTIVKRAEAIRAATKEVRRLYAKQQVNNALAIRNRPNTMATVDLPL
jgi:ketopantoate reductase